MPVKQIAVNDPGYLFKLKKYYMRSYALSVYIPEHGANPLGLREGTSYNIVDMIEVNEPGSADSKIKAIRLRDPWTNGGPIAYTGPEYKQYGQIASSFENKTFLMDVDLF